MPTSNQDCAAPRFLLDDPPDAETSGELGLDVGPRDVAVPEHHQGMEDEVGHLVDQMLSPRLARLIRRLDDLGRLLDDLSTDLGDPPIEQRDHVRTLRSAAAPCVRR